MNAETRLERIAEICDQLLLEVDHPDARSLVHEIDDLATGTNQEETTDVTIFVATYDDRRYGRPWIGEAVEWDKNATTPTLHYGRYIGDDDGGELVLLYVPVGSVIRWGRNDIRRPDRSTDYYGVVNADGQVHVVKATTARHKMNGHDVDLGESVPQADLRV